MNHQYYHHIIEYDRWKSAPCQTLPLPELCKAFSLFGTKKIEIYKTLDEALQRYTGEGTVYRITRKEIPVRKIEAKKKIEITEYEWIVDDEKEKGPK